jgi:hypothetical protein
MNDQSKKRFFAAVVPLSLFGLAFVLLSPPGWVGALKRSLDESPALVVVDSDLSFDPSDLRGLIWLPQTALKKSLLGKVKRLLWLRPKDAEAADLLGVSPSSCRQAHGVQLCLIDSKKDTLWRLSENLRGVSAKSAGADCVSEGGAKKCAYGKENWEYLRREEHTFNGQTRNCIWSHPVAQGALTIRIPKLPAGTYVLGAGIDDSGMRDGLPAVQVKVSHPERGEQPLIEVGEKAGFRSYSLPALSRLGDLELTILVEKTGARFFCWELTRKK